MKLILQNAVDLGNITRKFENFKRLSQQLKSYTSKKPNEKDVSSLKKLYFQTDDLYGELENDIAVLKKYADEIKKELDKSFDIAQKIIWSDWSDLVDLGSRAPFD